MIFIPVCDTWKGHFFYKGIKVDLDSHRTESQVFGSITQPKKAASLTSGLRKVTDLLQGYASAIIFTYDSKAGRPTVFSVWLLIKRKFLQN